MVRMLSGSGSSCHPPRPRLPRHVHTAPQGQRGVVLQHQLMAIQIRDLTKAPCRATEAPGSSARDALRPEAPQSKCLEGLDCQFGGCFQAQRASKRHMAYTQWQGDVQVASHGGTGSWTLPPAHHKGRRSSKQGDIIKTYKMMGLTNVSWPPSP